MRCPIGGECDVTLTEAKGHLWYGCRGKQFMLLTPEGYAHEGNWLELDLHPDNISQVNGYTVITNLGIDVYLKGERERQFWQNYDTEEVAKYLAKSMNNPGLSTDWNPMELPGQVDDVVAFMINEGHTYSISKDKAKMEWTVEFRKDNSRVVWRSPYYAHSICMAAYKVLTDKGLTP